ncbi:2-C-methyl-D-erythritol 4-phosphate cytidylyltransferase [Pseudoteredinibacter isoporae]|uniref:2-C-methyl-D-erythritol 4-phosphate cytidylyltransferase n=1 Tax=Pseudoteredinibacter isoporae TaxID=570281 RepID=A0A7X0MV80_9GAMM|nr:2-C-methyl-D-erythritol 4-phosphate cytidylyltransferase [Pseudoteredinibacter isoporae]MBB6521446.1 2-C-methyl-D-erythritol 4-phosphate cytidylyltransferase [Pseudoteredinibacter isoporae]NHO87000.1 2-C-methyl-D-erythritol 4-phosphate cytidylyltransferase [Pseudoteredinibacter isoporae]NIB24547.1 2-C-methyl-D-erythritol 4-phosphate cytidylyltransferase [Pseudoteredinibacter isoporae]
MSVRYWAVVPAAGIGSRMASDRPKQYLPLQHKTVIEHSLQHLLSHERIEAVYIPLAEHDGYWPDLRISRHPKIKTLLGGKERADSVLNTLTAMADVAGDQDWVLVHDAARPCLRKQSVHLLLDTLSGESRGGILANPVNDTIKKVANEDEILETVDRQQLWQAQTPQMFRFGLLRDSLQRALAAGVNITDEASAVEWAGHSAKVVCGPSDNIKITRAEDLPLAEFILSRQNESC